jgi:hypothetical protein
LSIRVKNPTSTCSLDDTLQLLNDLAEDLGCSKSPYRGNGTIDGSAFAELIDEMVCYLDEGPVPEPEPGIEAVDYDTVMGTAASATSAFGNFYIEPPKVEPMTLDDYIKLRDEVLATQAAIAGVTQVGTGRLSTSPPSEQRIPNTTMHQSRWERFKKYMREPAFS